MEIFKFPKLITKWYNNYLRDRYIELNLKGVHATRKLNVGVAQGGVLSPRVFCQVINELLIELNTGLIHAIGFADDIALLITGKNPMLMQQKLQTQIDRAVNWGNKKA